MQLDAMRAQLWQRLKDEYALIAPKGSAATPSGGEYAPVGRPRTKIPRAQQRFPVASETDPRLANLAAARPTRSGYATENKILQKGMGIVTHQRQTQGLSRLWVDSAEVMPISAVPPQIRKSLYQPLSHRVGLWPMNDKWYPIAENANTRNDLRFSVGLPPKAGPGNTPNAVSQSARYQFRRAWRVPRYSTQPNVAVPQSR